MIHNRPTLHIFKRHINMRYFGRMCNNQSWVANDTVGSAFNTVSSSSLINPSSVRPSCIRGSFSHGNGQYCLVKRLFWLLFACWTTSLSLMEWNALHCHKDTIIRVWWLDDSTIHQFWIEYRWRDQPLQWQTYCLFSAMWIECLLLDLCVCCH